MTIKVSLNISVTPPVTVNPTKETVNNGNQTVVWVPAANQPSFTFVGVTFSTNPNPFSAPTITTSPVQMSVTDSNTKSGVDYPYMITVNSNGINYNSATLGIGGNDGDPMIHNK
jgi:phosphoribulokinase